jgi:hypothetical protein
MKAAQVALFHQLYRGISLYRVDVDKIVDTGILQKQPVSSRLNQFQRTSLKIHLVLNDSIGLEIPECLGSGVQIAPPRPFLNNSFIYNGRSDSA